MIVFDLSCRAGGHRFEGWFGSSDDFSRQQERGLVSCPVCGSSDVAKAVMAPNVGRKGNQGAPQPTPAAPSESAEPSVSTQPVASNAPMPPQVAEALNQIAALQAEALKSSRWVGNKFAENARAMHYGETDAEAIHGEVTKDEARDLIEEGVEVAPILFPVAPPNEAN
ncbi:DUF1178 family protein [Novosphingobium sp. ZN18A2]|uniref:DUF1178 family protein n=1 Tax=Novosphingobium sp. ZN18A2 TaxID=3079861 RepID=UPI0030D54B5F